MTDSSFKFRRGTVGQGVKQQMKIHTQLLVLLAAALAFPKADASAPPSLCKALRGFIESVQRHEERGFAFHLSLAGKPEGDSGAINTKRCGHDGYESTVRLCDYLTQHGSPELNSASVKDAISCLSETKFAPSFRPNGWNLSFNYGTEHRGALIEVTFEEGPEVGGVALRLEADGY